MSNRLTQKDFLLKCFNIHGTRYSYPDAYINSKTKLRIICQEHGGFFQLPKDHLRGTGCPRCGGSKKLTTKEFVEKANQIHNGKYKYPDAYVNSKTKLRIICPEHGEFMQLAYHHMRGHGCQECVGMKKMTTELFKEKSKILHDNQYDYSLVDYNGNKFKVEILCLKHGGFWQRPNAHLNNHGCPVCRQSSGERKIRKFLKTQKINYIFQKTFDQCRFKRELIFDFYLPEHNLCIEYNGRQHYEPVNAFGGLIEFEKIQKRDKLKESFCRENDISLLVISFKEKAKINDILLDSLVGI